MFLMQQLCDIGNPCTRTYPAWPPIPIAGAQPPGSSRTVNVRAIAICKSKRLGSQLVNHEFEEVPVGVAHGRSWPRQSIVAANKIHPLY